MATIKSFTSLEQSKKLAEILSLESADMYYCMWDRPLAFVGSYKRANFINGDNNAIPCWSLASLFNVLPVIIGNVLSKNALRLRMDKSEIDFNVWYENIDTDMVEEGFDVIKTNPVDACYELVLKLNELNLL